MMTINKEIAFILSAAVLFFAGCSVKYTLSGQSIPADARTVSVGFFLNKAPLANPAFSQQFTEERETRLQLVASGGDLEFEGAVTGYSVTPMAIQGNETAANNRLSISIFVSYVNNLDETQNFQTSFSRFADFTSDQSLTSVESQLLPVISEQLIQDVFNRAFINW
jgi:hypothetical protein